MKRIKSIILLVCGILLTQGAMAQLSSVRLNTYGSRVHFGVRVDGLGEVIVDGYGQVLGVKSRVDHSNDDVRYEYYSGFNSYEAGKIKSIGSVKFTYYSNFNDYEAGKVKTIGGVSVSYYSNFHDYESGKVKSVAGVKLSYYSNFNSYEAGKIKSIGRHRYDYFSDFGGALNAGEPKSGYAKVKVDGIDFRVTHRRR